MTSYDGKMVLKNYSNKLIDDRSNKKTGEHFYSIRFNMNDEKNRNRWGCFAVPDWCVSASRYGVKNKQVSDKTSEVYLGEKDRKHKVSYPTGENTFATVNMTAEQIYHSVEGSREYWIQQQNVKEKAKQEFCNAMETAVKESEDICTEVQNCFEKNGFIVDYSKQRDHATELSYIPTESDTVDDRRYRFTRQDGASVTESEKVRENISAHVISAIHEEQEAENNQLVAENEDAGYKRHSSSVMHDHEQLLLDRFNRDRGLSVCDASGKIILHTSSDGLRYPASIRGVNDKSRDKRHNEKFGYAFSEDELAKLDNGDYIIAADVPYDKSFVHFKVHLDKETKSLVKDSIEMTDPAFADATHNERYAMYQSYYDSRISSVQDTGLKSAERKESEISRLEERGAIEHHAKGPQENPYKPTIVTKAFTKRGMHAYSQPVLNKAYQAIHVLPASDSAKELGFETQYDEERFNQKNKTAKRGLAMSEHHFEDYVNELALKQKQHGLVDGIRNGLGAIYYNDDGTSVVLDFKGENLQRNINVWQQRNVALDEERRLRSMPCEREDSKSLGLKSAWEEKILDSYDALKKQWETTHRIPKNDRSATIIFEHDRLQEALFVRNYGINELAKSRSHDDVGFTYFGEEDKRLAPDFADV